MLCEMQTASFSILNYGHWVHFLTIMTSMFLWEPQIVVTFPFKLHTVNITVIMTKRVFYYITLYFTLNSVIITITIILEL